MYDLRKGGWATDILAECKIDTERLGKLSGLTGGAVGTIGKDVAKSLGLKGPIILASGGHDQACAALGSGVVKPGLAMVSTGTAEVVEVAMSKPALTRAIEKAGISIYRHVVPDLYLAMTLNHSGGLLLRWFRDTLCQYEINQAKLSGEDPYDLILEGSRNGPTALMVLPHFAGLGTPTLDTTSRGVIAGLTFADCRSSIAKAILEGVTFELCINLDLLKESGIKITELHAVGGGAKNKLWLHLKADICKIPLRVPRVTEAACLGAALLAGCAAGVYPNLSCAVAQSVCLQRRIKPDKRQSLAYNRRYRIYCKLYPAIIPLLRKL